MRVIFLGTPEFAVPSLKKLLASRYEVCAVVTQPDRPAGRGRRIQASPVKLLAAAHGLPVHQPEKIRNAEHQAALASYAPDFLVVVAFGQILPRWLLETARLAPVNVHASLLPRYRGAAPVNWAILNGEEITGITIMRMDEGMDTGDILSQAQVQIEKGESAETLEEKLSLLGGKLLAETIEKIKKGEISPIPQDHTRATYAPPLKKEDGKIDWRREAELIDRQVRAFNPWPGAFTRWNDRLLKVYRGEVRKHPRPEEAGRVIWVGSDFIEVATGKDSFIIKEVQLEGKRRMGVREFLLGHPITIGTIFE